jgi:hypothetical protein
MSGLIEIENQEIMIFVEHAIAELSKRKRRTMVDESVDESHLGGLVSHGLFSSSLLAPNGA